MIDTESPFVPRYNSQKHHFHSSVEMYTNGSEKLLKIFHLNYLTSCNLSVIFIQITIWKAKPVGKDLAARNGHQGGPFPTHVEATGWCHRCPEQPWPPRSEWRLCPHPSGVSGAFIAAESRSGTSHGPGLHATSTVPGMHRGLL